MKNDAITKLKQARLSRRAQLESGLKDKIKQLQKQVVVESFSKEFNRIKHESMMKRLRELKVKFGEIGKINLA